MSSRRRVISSMYHAVTLNDKALFEWQDNLLSFMFEEASTSSYLITKASFVHKEACLEMNCSLSLHLHVVTFDEGKSSSTKVYAHHMVRTDSREQTLHAFLPPKDHVDMANASNRYEG